MATVKRVLIIGGYGNFGSFIAASLAPEPGIRLIIAGRSQKKAEALVAGLKGPNPPQAAALDINAGLAEALADIAPDLVIHTSGPFQAQGYKVARACLARGCAYIDLADGRDFVRGITALDRDARDRGTLVISGASSVPCFTSALVDHYLGAFNTLEALDYGITTAQKTPRGLATTAAILSYTGKRFQALADGKPVHIHGWQNLHARNYPGLGRRWLGNCDVPDLALFPERYPNLKTLRFYAGLELPPMHFGLWALSWLVRIGLIKNLGKAAPLMLKAAHGFDWLGSDRSGFHMELSGRDENGGRKKIIFELTAGSGDGPHIPCIPAILLARKFAAGRLDAVGAFACMGFITAGEILDALAELDINWSER